MLNKLGYPARVIVGALLIAAAIGKGIFFNTFVNEINYYAILPDNAGVYAALCILATEIILGASLLAQSHVKFKAWLAIGLLIVFITAKTSVIIRGIDLACCNCFGTLLSLPLWASYATSGIMIGLLLLATREGKCQQVKRKST